MGARISGTARLTADPDRNTTSNGKSVSNLRLAIDDGYGDYKKTIFIDGSVWGGWAENFEGRKGDLVSFSGRLSDGSYDNKKTGKRVNKAQITIEEIHLIQQSSGRESNNSRRGRKNGNGGNYSRYGGDRQGSTYGDSARFDNDAPF